MRPALLALTLLVATTCAGAAAPKGAADITGAITNVAERIGGITMLVEEDPADRSGGAKASVAVDGGTKIVRRGDTGEVAATLSELRPPTRVSVWLDGPVAMSYPVQGKARFVVILAPR